MRRPALSASPSGLGRSCRRLVVAVVGDSNLDSTAMKAHRVAGDEARKQQLAEEVGLLVLRFKLEASGGQ